MTELETRMRAMLEKTGLYFGEDKWLSAELAAYAKGLELVYDTLSHVRRDAFVQTAEEDGLKKRLNRCSAWCHPWTARKTGARCC